MHLRYVPPQLRCYETFVRNDQTLRKGKHPTLSGITVTALLFWSCFFVFLLWFGIALWF